MAVLTEFVVVDYHVALVTLTVIFLILFLLYRERRQHQHTSVTIAGNVTISPTYHYPQKGLSDGGFVTEKPNKPKKVDDGEDDDRAKSEPSCKIAEEPSHDDEEARNVRRRKTRRRSPDNRTSTSQMESITRATDPHAHHRAEQRGESEQRVFSQAVIEPSETAEGEPVDNDKAFSDTKPATSKKKCETVLKEEVEFEQFNSDMSLLDERKIQSQQHQNTTIKEARTETTEKFQIPHYKAPSSTDPFTFTVDQRGCHVEAKYCTLDIPPKSVTKPMTITMKPNYWLQYHSSKEVLVTPYVEFTSQDGSEPWFNKDVTLALHTGYAAVDDGSKPTGDAKRGIPVKVMYRSSPSSPFEFVKEAFLQQDSFISFTCRHFCGYCCTADQSQFHSMRRRYYYAGYVRESVAATRVFHWIIFGDCPAEYDRKLRYLESRDKNTVIDPESFYVRYDYTLQMIIKTGTHVCPGEHNHEDVQLNNHWGSRVDESQQFEIKKAFDQLKGNLKVEYKMYAFHNRDGLHLPIKEKHFYYEWKEPPPNDPQRPPLAINVYGRDAAGIQCNSYSGTEPQPVQHQESVDSNRSGYSSGYGSPPPSAANRSFQGGFNGPNQSASPSTSRQDSGFNDVEEAARLQGATNPKILSPIHSPKRRSTPRNSPVPPEVDSRAPDLTRRTANTCSEDDPITPESLQSQDSGMGEFSSMPENSLGTGVDPLTPDLSVHSLNVPFRDEEVRGPPSSDSSPPDSLEPEGVSNGRRVPSSDAMDDDQNENGGMFPENRP